MAKDLEKEDIAVKTYNKVCIGCNNPFICDRLSTRYCSQKCGLLHVNVSKNPKKIDLIEKQCLACENIFISAINRNRKYCSLSCFYVHGNRYARPHNNARGGKIFNCLVCYKEMYISPAASNRGKKYCSKVCMYEGIKKDRAIIDCLYCGTKKSVKRSYADRGRYCSWKCYSLALRKDIVKSARVQINKHRTMDKCERCGYSIYPKILQVHHKDRDRENNEIENLEVLCPNCHKIEHYIKPIEGITLQARI